MAWQGVALGEAMGLLGIWVCSRSHRKDLEDRVFETSWFTGGSV